MEGREKREYKSGERRDERHKKKRDAETRKEEGGWVKAGGENSRGKSDWQFRVAAKRVAMRRIR